MTKILLSLVNVALRFLSVYLLGRKSERNSQLKKDNKELKRHAEIDATPVDADSALDGLQSFGARQHRDATLPPATSKRDSSDKDVPDS